MKACNRICVQGIKIANENSNLCTKNKSVHKKKFVHQKTNLFTKISNSCMKTRICSQLIDIIHNQSKFGISNRYCAQSIEILHIQLILCKSNRYCARIFNIVLESYKYSAQDNSSVFIQIKRASTWLNRSQCIANMHSWFSGNQENHSIL